MPHAFPITESQWSRDIARNAVLSAPDKHVVTFERRMVVTENTRGRVLEFISKLAAGWRMKITKPNRTKEQNDKMWPMLTDLSVQKPLGRSYTPEQWKAVMMRAKGHEVGYLLDINGEPFPVGYRSSRLKVSEMVDLIDYIYSFGAEHGIQWSEPGSSDTYPEGTNKTSKRNVA
jgi:hypothetical protein